MNNLSLAYKLFDADGDGDLSPEEFSRILTSIGETPGDLNMFFSGMTSETFTDFKPCVDFISFMIKHGQWNIYLQYFIYFLL